MPIHPPPHNHGEVRCTAGHDSYDDGMTPKQLTEVKRQAVEENGGLFCPTCGKKFSGKYEYANSNYQRHLREQSTRVECSYCPSTFARPGNLHKHLLEKHPQQVCMHCGTVPTPKQTPPQRFQCPLCPRTCRNTDDLNAHLNAKHRNQR
ncbi:uncharacterized protein Z520_00662 [Fonsecaea multimorphosa CBS 102226]|uniref:C2H2-type domain-containing protein n=1 Tax=Fonsecaea multimorphosa CBS 102226 TaxID=1442371 RepID=A0A0D2KKI3_9EURO|nr:uncharacterized protein Z520_00662 [Fonsecaea multimorphosa CBS 102226]KIY03970.1 hypothetical protein Z520_00662 [Fonsecaea multimorphosa CBS 102226]